MPKGFGELASLHTLTKFVACNDEAAGGLIELKGLKSLRGDLMIVNLEKAESIDVYALKNKPLLQFLVLDWANFCWTNLFGPYVTSSTNDEVVMEMLCPHHNLRRMDIYHYGGVKFPEWLSFITNLAEISLLFCSECEYLPPLHRLPYLKKLIIAHCPKLKGIDEEEEEEEWPQFRCLSRLYILDCPNLTQMPLFPAVETGLELIRTSSMPLIRTMMMKMTTKEVAALSKLTYLDLRELNDLEYLPEEGVRNLGSLRVMVIVSCPRLGSLPRAMQELASLQKLKIERCPQLAERCREGLGEDWPNISHVPEIQLH
ncbi:Disease resistance protein RGA2 [Linum perenne]